MVSLSALENVYGIDGCMTCRTRQFLAYLEVKCQMNLDDDKLMHAGFQHSRLCCVRGTTLQRESRPPIKHCQWGFSRRHRANWYWQMPESSDR